MLSVFLKVGIFASVTLVQRTLWWLFFLIFIFGFLNLFIGSVSISFIDVVLSLFGKGEETHVTIIQDYRMPKLWASVCTGICIPLSGLLMQTFFRNILAGPYILGVSSGAGLGVALVLFLSGFSISLLPFGEWSLILAAMIGAILFLLLIGSISIKIYDNSVLLIIGILLSSFASSLIAILEFSAPSDALKRFVFWTFGSLGGLSYTQLFLFSFISLLGLGISLFLSKSLNALLLGDENTSMLGISLKRTKIMIILTTGTLTGMATALVGPILFVGIIIPFLARTLLQTLHHFHMIIGTVLIGVNSMIIFDILTHLSIGSSVFPINVVTSLIGVPIVLWIILFQNRTVRGLH